MKKIFYIIFGIIILILSLLLIKESNKSSNHKDIINWTQIAIVDLPTFSAEWEKTPVRIQSNDEGWEDSLFVTPDGQRIYFAYYASDLIGDAKRGKFNGDIDTYYSDIPFTTKVKDNRFHLSEKIWSEACIDIDIDGNVWYCSNRDYLNDKKSDTDIFRNNERIAMNDVLGKDREFGNPHYCKAKDELWFDEKDTSLFVLKKAEENNFTGTPELAPSPLQVSSASSFQPWLSEDCNTIYFTSNRGDTNSKGPAIYLSIRSGESWSNPELVAQSKTGVAEPTLTKDGKKLFFIQLFKDEKSGVFTTEMFYVERN